MRYSPFLRFLGLLFLLFIPSVVASAQDSVKCESNDGHRNYCGQYNSNQVRLERQISGSACVEGKSWGVDGRGLWVDRGCRAYFTVRDNRRGGGNWNNSGGRDSVTCESNDGHRKYCGRYGYNQVRLDRQISGSPCVQGQSWGVDGSGLWVDRGCRAIFAIGGYAGGGPRPGGPDEVWWNRDPNDTWPPRGNWHGGNWGQGGACFYRDRNFGGGFFCMRRGEQRASLSGYGDDISSIRLFGGARVVVFDDRNFSGARDRLGRDVSDLRQLNVSQKPGHTWNNRISSISIQ
jgi:Protein of unknown function (DUF3011)